LGEPLLIVPTHISTAAAGGLVGTALNGISASTAFVARFITLIGTVAAASAVAPATIGPAVGVAEHALLAAVAVPCAERQAWQGSELRACSAGKLPGKLALPLPALVSVVVHALVSANAAPFVECPAPAGLELSV
jgi:hypothetical protein